MSESGFLTAHTSSRRRSGYLVRAAEPWEVYGWVSGGMRVMLSFERRCITWQSTKLFMRPTDALMRVSSFLLRFRFSHSLLRFMCPGIKGWGYTPAGGFSVGTLSWFRGLPGGLTPGLPLHAPSPGIAPDPVAGLALQGSQKFGSLCQAPVLPDSLFNQK